MIKHIVMGFWFCFVALSSTYLYSKQFLHHLVATGLISHARQRAGLQPRRIKDLTLSVIRDGDLQGFVTISFVARFDRGTGATSQALAEIALSDRAIRAANRTIIEDLRHHRKPDLAAFEVAASDDLRLDMPSIGLLSLHTVGFNFIRDRHNAGRPLLPAGQ